MICVSFVAVEYVLRELRGEQGGKGFAQASGRRGAVEHVLRELLCELRGKVGVYNVHLRSSCQQFFSRLVSVFRELMLTGIQSSGCSGLFRDSSGIIANYSGTLPGLFRDSSGGGLPGSVLVVIYHSAQVNSL